MSRPRKVETVKRKYFKQTRIILSIVLTLMLVLSPLSFVYAETAPAEEAEAAKGIFGNLDFAKMMAEAEEKALDQVKVNSRVSFEFGPNMMMPADQLELLSNLLLDVDFEMSMVETPAAFYDIKVQNKQFEGSGFQIISYNVGEKNVVEIPKVLEKPIVLDLNALMASVEGMEDLPINGRLSADASKELMEIIPQAMQDMFAALENFFNKFTDQGAQPVTLSIADLSEDLISNEKIMPANDFILAAKDFLSEIRASEAFIKYMDDYVLKFMGTTYATSAGEELPESIVQVLDQAIANLEQNTDVSNEEGHVRLSQYVTAEGEARGFSWALFDAAKQEDIFGMDSYYLSDESGKHTPFIFKMTGPDEEVEGGYSSMIMEVDLNEVEENIFAGSYKFEIPGMGEVVTGTFDNATVVEILPGQEQLVGNFDTTIKAIQTVATYTKEVAEIQETIPAQEELPSEGETVEEATVEEVPATEGEIVYEEVESFVGLKVEISSEGEGKVKTIINVTPDKNLDGQFVKVIAESVLEEVAESTIPTEIPAGAMEVKSPEDLNALSEDPELQERAMNAIYSLMGQEVPAQ